MSEVENYTERDYPGSMIRIVSWTDAEIISINVFVGPERSALSASFPRNERTAAATHYAFVQNGARAGRTEAALLADLSRTPVSDGVFVGRSVRITRTQVFRRPLSAMQRALVEKAQSDPARHGIIVAEDASWLTLRSIVDKGWADIIEREGGRVAGKILAIRVRGAVAP